MFRMAKVAVLVLIANLCGRRVFPLLRRLGQERFETYDFRFGRCEIADVRRHLLRRQFTAGFLGVKDGVAESLSEAVDGLASAKQVEANSTLIERALGRLSRAIQFLTEPIE